MGVLSAYPACITRHQIQNERSKWTDRNNKKLTQGLDSIIVISNNINFQTIKVVRIGS